MCPMPNRPSRAHDPDMGDRAWRRWVTVATVVTLAATGLVGIAGDARPAAAQVPIAEPSECVTSPDGLRVECAGVSVPTAPLSPFPPPLQVSGFLERLVRGPAAEAWLPLEIEAKTATAELHGVPNDNRLLVTGRDSMRTYLYLRLLALIDQRKAGTVPLTAEENNALAALQTAVVANRSLVANKAIEEYDRWSFRKCSGYQPPPGFGFDPYDPGALCQNPGVLFGGPHPPTFEQFQSYGTALAFQEFTASGDAAAAFQKLDIGAGFAYATFSALAGGLATGAIIGTLGAEVTKGIVKSLAPFAVRVISKLVQDVAVRVGATIAQRLLTHALTSAAASLISSVVGIIVFGVAFSALSGVIFSENASIRQKLVDARDQIDVDLAETAATTEGQLLLLGVVIEQTLPDLASERADLIQIPTSPPPGQLQWGVTIPGAPETTQPVLTTLAWDFRQQQTFVADGYFVTSVAGGPWVLSLTLDYLGGRVISGQLGQKRRLGIRGNRLWDHAVDLPVPPSGVVIVEAPELSESIQFLPNLTGVPLNSSAPGPLHTARLVGNRPPTLTGGTTYHLTGDQTSLLVLPPGILGLVADPDGGAMTIGGFTDPPSGQVTFVGTDGAFRYDRNGAPLPDHFAVTVTDEDGGSTAVPITIAPNQAPTLSPNSVLVPPSTPFAYICPAVDPDGDPLQLEVVQDAQQADVTPHLGCLKYEPGPAASGADQFSVRASDGKGGTVTGTIGVTIALPQFASFVRLPTSVPEDTEVVFRLNGFPSISPTADCGSGSVRGLTTTELRCLFPDPSPAEIVSLTDHFPSGASATTAVTVAVTDATPPAWGAFPDDIVETAATSDSAGRVVTYPIPTATDAVSPPATVSCAPSSGTTFGVGVTVVECTASDALGNTDRRTFAVRVGLAAAGVAAPTWATFPSDIVVPAESPNGRVVTFVAPTATGTPPLTVACTPATGALFPIGTTTVTCMATDAVGNTTGPRTFSITVDPFAAVVQGAGSARGYWLVTDRGVTLPHGDAPPPSANASGLGRVAGIVATPSGLGWLAVGPDGAIDVRGDATSFGSMAGQRLARPIVGIVGTPTGRGYWLVADDGGVFAFGDAVFLGSTGGRRLNQRIVGMAATPSGQGYWLVGRDGGVFAFGDARFLGSTGGRRLNQPIVGMAPTPSGQGYWLVGRDGGVFAFGDAAFLGSTGNRRVAHPVVGMATTSTGRGYWLVADDGGVFTFGDAPFLGSSAGAGARIIGIVPIERSVP